MTQVEGIPYRRHGPPAALKSFLEPLGPGGYIDCGPARLHGIDDALVEEAKRRGRDVGDDMFYLVAADNGLIFSRPSIGFAITAAWSELKMIRPSGADDPAVLQMSWPKHGDLEFTLSRRLGENLFRRWLELKAKEGRGFQTMSLSKPRRDTGEKPAGPKKKRSHDKRSFDLFADQGVFGTNRSLRPSSGEADETMASRKRALSTDRQTEIVDPQEETDPVGSGFTTPASNVSLIDDGDLQRVALPRSVQESNSWLGSPLSLVASVVFLSSAVLIVAVAVGLARRNSQVVTAGDSVAVATQDSTRTTIDYQRFRPAVEQNSGINEGGSEPSSPRSDVPAQGQITLSGPLAADSSLPGTSDAGGEAGSPASTTEPVNSAGVVDQAGPTASAADVDVVDVVDAVDAAGPAKADGVAAAEATESAAGAAPDDQSEDLGALPSGAEGALRCDSNYSGCVPPVAELEAAPGVQLDVDCEGQGDGPWLIAQQVTVLGTDIYGLDTDGDGIACEQDQTG